ncbi:uncharacterized protein LOC135700317 [Ochlerotatus camptorhynchus]|uniref:uncharacterized protein LOC135700317 n=1 Tax=Ochlerotatus camptorhynchus TaxID=644619 RepID=UPI0031D05F0E
MSKTIETHLQSNEVRIPKKTGFDVSSSAAPCQYFKSSFARSLSFNQNGGSPYGGAGQHHFTRSLDFEVNFGLATIPDQPSSVGSGGGGSSQTTPSASPVYDPEREGNVKTKLVNGIATSNGGVVKTLWNYSKGSDSKMASPGGTPTKLSMGAASASAATATSIASLSSSTASSSSTVPFGSGSSSSTRKSVEANEIEVLRLRKECQNLIEENRRLVNLAANSGYAINGVMNGGSNGGPGSGSSSLTTLGLGLTGGGTTGSGAGNGAPGMYSNVESVILQTQVETLQWQLKQVDSSRQMYRAVMEEVVRYLDRCYRSLDALQPNVIGRSKSVLQVSKNNANHDSDSSSASSPRARSSTNLNDVQKSYTKKQQELLIHHHHQQQRHPASTGSAIPLLDDDCAPSSPASSYSTFRDFTWRRSPKRTQTLPISSVEVDPEKLAQEAFRLLRTVQNLLNTQEPTLSQSSTALDSLLLASAAGSTTGSTSTLTGAGAGGGSSSATVHHHHHHHHMPGAVEAMYGGVVNARSNVAFSRKLNMRGSRLSLRSSTDDSVHSTSSSNKTETDEDNTDRPSPPLGHHLHHPLVHQHQNSGSSSSSSTTSSNSGHLINHRHSANIDRIKEMMISSSAEDESGFSSMNSFQEIGLPLINSTMLSSSSAASSTTGVCSVDSNSSAASSTGSVSFVSDESSDLRDNTVIPTASIATTIAINPSSSSSSSTNSTLTNMSNGSSKHLSDKLGIPSPSKAPEIPARVTQSAAYEHHNHFINHRRWDSAPVVPPKLKIHRHNGTDSDGGVSSRVLWV